MKLSVPIFLLLLIVFILLFFSAKLQTAFAQVDSLGIAIPVETIENVQNGDIICTKQGGIGLCNEEYDPSIFGVITQNPPIALESDDLADSPLAIQSGDTIVRVSTSNGNIAVGDLITSSKTPGVGQKATFNGFVLGIALEAYESSDPANVGLVLVSINIHPSGSFVGSRSNLIANIRQALSSPIVSPLDSLRYLLAFIIAIISFALGFVYFGRVVKTGVEAIGRNPLASRMIQITVLINVVITIVIVLTGLAVALLILIV